MKFQTNFAFFYGRGFQWKNTRSVTRLQWNFFLMVPITSGLQSHSPCLSVLGAATNFPSLLFWGQFCIYWLKENLAFFFPPPECFEVNYWNMSPQFFSWFYPIMGVNLAKLYGSCLGLIHNLVKIQPQSFRNHPLHLWHSLRPSEHIEKSEQLVNFLFTFGHTEGKKAGVSGHIPSIAC